MLWVSRARSLGWWAPCARRGGYAGRKQRLCGWLISMPPPPLPWARPPACPLCPQLLDWLHANAMPQKLPDGRSESPGVMRIYVASMVILALFYATSTALGAVLKLVQLSLQAAGIIKGGGGGQAGRGQPL